MAQRSHLRTCADAGRHLAQHSYLKWLLLLVVLLVVLFPLSVGVVLVLIVLNRSMSKEQIDSLLDVCDELLRNNQSFSR